MAAKPSGRAPVREHVEPVLLDVDHARLQRGGRGVGLRPKDLAVLRTLVGAHGRLLRKEALIEAGWPDVSVTDSVLKACVNRLRLALGDDPKVPRFIQTVPRQGYRFIGDIVLVDETATPPPLPSRASHATAPDARPIVGRAREITELHRAFADARRGARRVVLVSGEAGVGKTALVDLFLDSRGPTQALVGHGQCVESYGAGEAYRPLLEALAGIGRGPGRRTLVACLASHAPSWLAQMAGLVSAARLDRLRARTAGVTRERMLRELADALGVLAQKTPLVLVIEDLHWSDASTLDAIATLARRRDPARLLVVGTYRPEDVLPREHALPALVRELRLQRLSRDLALGPLGESAVETYLSLRFPGAELPRPFARALHQQTDGHPLFLVTLADHWIASGSMVHRRGRWQTKGAQAPLDGQVPDDIRLMIEARLDRLTVPERRVIDAASVSGVAFAAASIAAALGARVAAVDERCDALARRQFMLCRDGRERWPDGTSSGRYRFMHALYQNVAYAQVPAARRQELHRRIAAAEEAAYGANTDAIAARLAVQFEEAGLPAQAVQYRAVAARTANALNGYQEAIGHAHAGLALLDGHPTMAGRARIELQLQLALGTALAATEGFAATAAERAYARAEELSRNLGGVPEGGPVLAGLYAYHLMRGPVSTVGEIVSRLARQAEQTGDHAFIVWSRLAAGVYLLQDGDPRAARAAFESCLALYDRRRHGSYLVIHAIDPGLGSLGYLSWCLWILGHPEQALACGMEAVALARDLAHPLNLAHTLVLHAHLHQLRNEVSAASDCAGEAICISEEHSLGQYLWPARLVRGWALTERGRLADGLADLQQSIDVWSALGATYAQTRHLPLLAEALGQSGRFDEAHAALDRALELVGMTGERCWEPEIHRVRAELLVREASRDGAAPGASMIAPAIDAARRALVVARDQQARSFELRAATTWHRAAALTGDARQARQALRDLRASFGEGDDTDDVRHARAVLG